MKILIIMTFLSMFAIFQSFYEILERADVIVATISAVLGFLSGLLGKNAQNKAKLNHLEEEFNHAMRIQKLENVELQKRINLSQNEDYNELQKRPLQSIPKGKK